MKTQNNKTFRQELIKLLWTNVNKLIFTILTLDEKKLTKLYLKSTKQYNYNNCIVTLINNDLQRNILFRYLRFILFSYKKQLININMNLIKINRIQLNLKKQIYQLKNFKPLNKESNIIYTNKIREILKLEQMTLEKLNKLKLSEKDTHLHIDMLSFLISSIRSITEKHSKPTENKNEPLAFFKVKQKNNVYHLTRDH